MYRELGCGTLQYILPTRYSTVQYNTVQCGTVQCSTAQYSAVQHPAVHPAHQVQYSTVQYCTVQHPAVHYILPPRFIFRHSEQAHEAVADVAKHLRMRGVSTPLLVHCLSDTGCMSFQGLSIGTEVALHCC